MTQIYKVFFKERKVIISAEDVWLTEGIELIYRYKTRENLYFVLHFFQEHPSLETMFIHHDQPKVVIEEIKSYYKVIKAGGGVVTNSRDELLFIFRRGKWDLPKGKLENGEDIQEGAIREVKEECGLNSVQVIEQLCSSYHVYEMDDKNVLKETTWFLMKTNQNQLVPQKEEDITRAEWFSKDRLQVIYDNTWSSIKELIFNSGLVNI